MRILKHLTTALRVALPAVLIAGAVLSLTACNTVSGLGQDTSAAGKAVTTGAEKTKDKM